MILAPHPQFFKRTDGLASLFATQWTMFSLSASTGAAPDVSTRGHPWSPVHLLRLARPVLILSLRELGKNNSRTSAGSIAISVH